MIKRKAWRCYHVSSWINKCPSSGWPYIRGKLLKGCDDFEIFSSFSLLSVSIQELRPCGKNYSLLTVNPYYPTLYPWNKSEGSSMQHAHVLLQGHAVDGQNPANKLMWQIHTNTPCLVVFQRVSTINWLSELCPSIISGWRHLASPNLSQQLRLSGNWKPSTPCVKPYRKPDYIMG